MNDNLEKATSLLGTWPQLARTLIFTTVFFVLLFAGLALSLYVFKTSGLSIESTKTGTSIQFRELNKNYRFDTILIHPRDWNDPQIKVKEGDQISLSAFGSVNVAAGLFNKSLATQYQHRDTNEKTIGREVGKMTDDQVEESLLTVPWNGPEGFYSRDIKQKNVKDTHDKESQKRIIPHQAIGQLVVAIVPDAKCPSKGIRKASYQLQPYEENMIFIASQNGSLCLVVNDQYSENQKMNDLFWDDNLGFFSVNLKIESQ